MASISGYDSSSLGVLFSSLNRNNTTSSLLGGGSDLLGINYSDYATIRNGSYFKLLSAYYSKSDFHGQRHEGQPVDLNREG